MNSTRLRLCPASLRDIPHLQALAREIWEDCYPAILAGDQIEFMLERMYGTAQLEDEIAGEAVRFFLLERDGMTLGFASLGPSDDPADWLLHKLYLKSRYHGRGWGSEALQALKRRACQEGAARLRLRVNRRNDPAIRCYERNGFRIERQEVSDIGNGFVMDDHWMVAQL